MQGQRFRINTPTLAVEHRAGKHLPLYIPAGDIVTVSEGPVDGTRLVMVDWNGGAVMMFSIDLRKRGTLLD